MTSLEDVLRDFDRRLKSIEKQLNHRGSQTPDGSIVTSKVDPLPSAPSGSGVDSGNRSSKAAIPSKEYRKIESSPPLDSSGILGVIGIIFVILAGVFFIKITIDSGWLTPMRQVTVAAGAGFAFFLIPQLFPKAEREYGSLLAGAGATILHLTWFGAYFYHSILGANAALICATLVGIFSLSANFGKANAFYVLIAMSGTYFSAPIVGYNAGELGVLSIFLIIWNISFSVLSLIIKRRDIMFIASYYAVFTVLLLSTKAIGYEQYFDLLVLNLVQFVIFASAMLYYSVFNKSALTSDESLAVLALLLLFYVSMDHVITAISPGFAPWFGMAIGAGVLGIYFLARSYLKGELKSGSALTAFAAITFVHSFYFEILSESLKPLAGLVLGVLVMMLWGKSATARERYFFPLIILASTFAYGALLTVISPEAFYFLYNWLYGGVVLVGVIGLASSREARPELKDYSSLLLGFAHLQIMLGLYRFSQQISWSGALFVTIAWGLYAALILAVAYARRDKMLGSSALTILLAVSLKAFFYDARYTSNLTRVVCLLAEGLLLYCGGWIFKKMQRWTTQ